MTRASLDADGVIHTDRVYSVPAFKRITGWGTVALRHAREKGLFVRRVGLRSYILGGDFLNFVAEHGAPVGQSGPVHEDDA